MRSFYSRGRGRIRLRTAAVPAENERENLFEQNAQSSDRRFTQPFIRLAVFQQSRFLSKTEQTSIPPPEYLLLKSLSLRRHPVCHCQTINSRHLHVSKITLITHMTEFLGERLYLAANRRVNKHRMTIPRERVRRTNAELFVILRKSVSPPLFWGTANFCLCSSDWHSSLSHSVRTSQSASSAATGRWHSRDNARAKRTVPDREASQVATISPSKSRLTSMVAPQAPA